MSFTCIGRFTRACNIGQMWGPPRLGHQAFHIPIADHGCKRTQVQFRTTAKLFFGSHCKVFQGSDRPAGSSWTLTGMCCCSFHFPHCLTAQLTEVIGLTLWEAVFRYMSQWSERQEGGNMSTRAALPSLHPTFSSHAKSREKVFLH